MRASMASGNLIRERTLGEWGRTLPNLVSTPPTRFTPNQRIPESFDGIYHDHTLNSPPEKRSSDWRKFQNSLCMYYMLFYRLVLNQIVRGNVAWWNVCSSNHKLCTEKQLSCMSTSDTDGFVICTCKRSSFGSNKRVCNRFTCKYTSWKCPRKASRQLWKGTKQLKTFLRA